MVAHIRIAWGEEGLKGRGAQGKFTRRAISSLTNQKAGNISYVRALHSKGPLGMLAELHNVTDLYGP